jgi:transketolase
MNEDLMLTSSDTALDELCINTIRFLALDAIQTANSGHPGMPMGVASLAYALWTGFHKHNPANPDWVDRDRFVLSAGHGSMLLYALLHLTGYDLSLDDIKRFRQQGSRAPGHPERGVTPGVETTTGPLGQGFGNAVGMAIAEAHLAASFNRPGFEIIDHFTYCLAGDGDLMEGVSAEAASLAGHLRLGKLVCFYDDNRISLAGSTALSFSEQLGERFAAYNWHIQVVSDGNSQDELRSAIQKAKAETTAPSLIMVRTHIGFGSPHKQDSFEAHGSPLGLEELALTKQHLGWPLEPLFHIPENVQNHFRKAREKGAVANAMWDDLFRRYEQEYPEAAAEFKRIISGMLPHGWDQGIPRFPADSKGMATRAASGIVMNSLAPVLPELVGGSADLNPSTLSALSACGDFQSPAYNPVDRQGAVGGEWGYAARNIHFGVREHAMGAIINGLAAHGGFIPYGATFLVFADYLRPSIRLAALMRLHLVYVFTHDSIAVGEDGPTHQPVEQLASLRAIPGLTVIRPSDANETAAAWQLALKRNSGPIALILTRQAVPTLDRGCFAPAHGLGKGAYILADALGGNPELILIASGSEVGLIIAARERLVQAGVAVRVVSMPSWELFEEQSSAYRSTVLPPEVKVRLAVECGITQGWHRYIGDAGGVIGVSGFGASAPGTLVYAEYGFTPENVCAKALALLSTAKAGSN